MQTPTKRATLSSCARTTILGLSALWSAAQASAQCDILAMAGGAGHTLALTSDGSVLAWGMNAYGELGNGTRSFAVDSPLPVLGLSGIVAVAAGEHFSLALDGNGRVFAWGENSYGALGNSSTTDVPTAVEVPGLSGIVAIAAGSHHVLALQSDGVLLAWGGTWAGQFGDPRGVYVPFPILTGLTGISRIAAGGLTSLALDDSGSVFAMGPLSGATSGPVLVPGLDSVIEIAAGGTSNGHDHALALRSDGSVWGWGDNLWGQLGDGSTLTRLTPEMVSGQTSYLSIAAGGYHSAAISSTLQVHTWGRNEYGQLGDGGYLDSSAPSIVSIPDQVSTVSCGLHHTMAILGNGSPLSWGWSGSGQLGRFEGSFTSTRKLLPVGSQGTVLAVSTRGDSTVWAGPDPIESRDHTLAIAEDGTVWAFGSNRFGQLGDGTKSDANESVAVAGLPGVRAIAAGARHSLALAQDGTVWSWGANSFGQLGDGTTADHMTPMPISGLSGVVAIAASDRDSLAVRDDGTVWTWGWFSGSPTPVGVGLQGSFVAVAAGAKFFLALSSDGAVYSWGWNDSGQLGIGSDEQVSTSPVLITSLFGVVSLSAGGSHALAARVDGSVWAWGDNTYGQLGDGTMTDRSAPVPVSGLGSMRVVAAGSDHSLAADVNGNAFAWGRNFAGESAAGNTGDGARKLLPVAVPQLGGVVTLVAGSTTSLALNGGGFVYGWGWNGLGQLGDSTINRSADPGSPALDVAPPPQGNILRMVRTGGDVVLDFGNGNSAGVWAVYRDPDKTSLGQNVLASPVLSTQAVDSGAIGRPANDFYSLTGLSPCSLTPGN